MAALRGKEEEKEALKGNQVHMKSAKMEEKDDDKEQEEEKASSIWDCGSPLYDSYELVCLSHLIERHLTVFPSCNGSSKALVTTFTHPSQDIASLMLQKMESPEKSKGSFVATSWIKFVMKMKMKMRKKKDNDGESRNKHKKKTSGIAGFFRKYGLCRK